MHRVISISNIVICDHIALILLGRINHTVSVCVLLINVIVIQRAQYPRRLFAIDRYKLQYVVRKYET